VDAGGGQQGADRDLSIGDVEVKLISSPPESAPVVAFFATNVAGGGDSMEHLTHGFEFGLFFDSSLSLSSASC